MLDLNELEKVIEIEKRVREMGRDYDYLGYKYSHPTPLKEKEIRKEFNCSFADKWILDAHAGTTFEYVNTQLRQERWVSADEFTMAYKLALTKTLDSLPSYNNKTAWRWLNGIPQEGIDFLKTYIGKNILIPQFYSTSTYKNEAGYDTFLKITTSGDSNGKYICDIVRKNSEKEILFKYDTVFQIKSFDDDSFILQEIKSKQIDLVLNEYFWTNDLIPQRVHDILYKKG